MGKCVSNCQCKRHIVSKEHRTNLSASMKGKIKSVEHLKNFAASRQGHEVTSQTRAKIRAGLLGNIPWNKGVPHTKETIAKIRAKAIGRKFPNRKRLSLEDRTKRAQITAAAHARGVFRGPTSLEYALQMLLESANIEFEAQIRFGRYVVDAWVPVYSLVFEADGEPWHTWVEQTKPGYHARRDRYLRERGANAIIHLTPLDLAPWCVS